MKTNSDHSKYTYLIVEACVRFWEDAKINGFSDHEGSLVPFKDDDIWKPVIELATGRIKDWPADKEADIYFKVCDAGDYWLADDQLNKLAKWYDHYVPDSFLAIGEDGFGDYIIMQVDKSGQIIGWETPEIDPDQWEELE